MDVRAGHKFQDEWLAKALIYYQIIDQALFDELAQRFAEEDYFFDVLVKNKYLTANDIAVFIENALQIPSVNLDEIDINPRVVELIPEEICQKYILMPFNMKGEHIAVACFNPFNLEAENEIEYLTGKYVKSFFAFKDDIQRKISEYYSPEKLIDSFVSGEGKQSRIKIAGESSEETKSAVVRLVNHILGEAIEKEASDIHIEPKEKIVTVRFRIDGVLRNILEVPRSVHPSLISRIKILSNLNIAESRKPQDGKAKVRFDDQDIDLRISVLPTSYGEKAVIRILDKRRALVSFEKMGLRGHNKELLEKCFEFKQGMVLVTGPTGSGKSTTLYAALNRIRSTTNNIITIEDPIEYMMDGINQVQVNEKAGVTFATALRSFLRQDPDVILVGEIRDRETADIAVQAALTGHLVLSTLHTNDTFSTISRLQDMGVDVYKISESVQAIIAQRLVRKLCEDCKEESAPDELETKLIPFMKTLGHQPKFFHARGCASCGFSGYKGRIGVYEILILDNELKDLIAQKAPTPKLRKAARQRGFRNLYEDALRLIADGITDYKEILRVVSPNSENSETPEEVKAPAVEQENTVPEEVAGNAETQTPLPVHSPAGHPPTEAAQRSKNSVLIVEDSSTMRILIKKIIEKMTDWEIYEAEDGVQALERIYRISPDVVVLDIMMPNMNGFDFLKHLRKDKKHARIPVLILTALNGPDNEVRGLELGADDYLVKPYNPQVLVSRIRKLMNGNEGGKNGKSGAAEGPQHSSAASNKLKLI